MNEQKINPKITQIFLNDIKKQSSVVKVMDGGRIIGRSDGLNVKYGKNRANLTKGVLF